MSNANNVSSGTLSGNLGNVLGGLLGAASASASPSTQNAGIANISLPVSSPTDPVSPSSTVNLATL